MNQTATSSVANYLADARQAYADGRLEAADELYRKALVAEPNNIEALSMLGLAIAQRGRLAEGLGFIDKAIGIHPGHGRIHFFRGNVLEHMKRYPEALQSYEHALRLEPNHAPTHLSQGISLAYLGQLQASIDSFNHALTLAPEMAEAYFNRGNSYQKLKQYSLGVADFQKVISLAPHFAPAYNNLGVCLKSLERYEEAIANYKQAIALQPDYYHAYNNIGVALHALGRFEEALEYYQKTLLYNSGYAEVYNNIGITLVSLRRYEEAINHYDTAIRLNPDYSEAINNKAFLLQELCDYDESLQHYNKALATTPDYANAEWNKSILLLLQGKYEEGWPLFESRWRKSDTGHVRNLAMPLWLGKEPLKGKTILLHAEQGLGDTLQFCRYASMVEALGAHVILEVQTPVLNLLKSLKGYHQLIANNKPLPAYDLHCPLMSLPLAFGTRVDSIPAPIPYLFAEDGKRARWKQMLAGSAALKVGVAWEGNPKHKNNHNRSIQLQEFAMLAEMLNGVSFHALQKDVSLADRERLNALKVAAYDNALTDFTDTAALIMELDLVITVDTAIAHLAGALGKPVWILLPFAPDFRWLIQRNDSPWYPTARLFRQQQKGQWQPVLAMARDALQQMQRKSA